jgi:hypothetical protein
MSKTLKELNAILVTVNFSSEYIVFHNRNFTDDEVIKELQEEYGDIEDIEVLEIFR